MVKSPALTAGPTPELVALDISCPVCGESDDLQGNRTGDRIAVTCGSCGQTWERPVVPVCPQCSGSELRSVPLAILEKGRGTQLSVVGIRVVQLCTVCDAEDIERWQQNRPNPLMPAELPTVDSTGD